jgi:predicted neuraminidase
MFQIGSKGMAEIGDIPCVSGTMISVDGGATWELSTDIYGQWSARPKVLRTADEPAIVAISDKEIFMVLRSARDDGLAEETWSHDGGRSWERPQPGKLHEFNTPTGLWRMKNGWVVRLWNNSKSARRMPLAVAISKDNCRTWSDPQTLVGFPADSKWPVQASYPSVVEAADGALVAVWCHVTPEGKWLWAGGRFTVDWALGK